MRREFEQGISRNLDHPSSLRVSNLICWATTRRGRRRDDSPPRHNRSQGKAATGQAVIPALTKAMRFPLRPGKGSFGTKRLVKANHFIAQLPDKDLHHYESTMFQSLRKSHRTRPQPSSDQRADVLKELLQAFPALAMTTNSVNATALETAAIQGHIDIVNLLLETDASLAKIARNNGKTVLHTAARMGHVEVVRSLLNKDPGIGLRTDKNGQTALHMASKGINAEIVVELLKPDVSVSRLGDNKGNRPHCMSQLGRRNFKVVIKFVARADLHRLGMFLAGKHAEAPQEALQVLDVLLWELSFARYAPFGRLFFSPDLGRRQPLGDGLEGWRGFCPCALFPRVYIYTPCCATPWTLSSLVTTPHGRFGTTSQHDVGGGEDHYRALSGGNRLRSSFDLNFKEDIFLPSTWFSLHGSNCATTCRQPEMIIKPSSHTLDSARNCTSYSKSSPGLSHILLDRTVVVVSR